MYFDGGMEARKAVIWVAEAPPLGSSWSGPLGSLHVGLGGFDVGVVGGDA